MVLWLLKIQDSAYVWRKSVDPRFLPFLLEKKKRHFFKAPLSFGVILSLVVLALSGPAYKLKADLQSNDTSEVVWVVKNSSSMLSRDLLPTRLKRATFKIDDFLSKRVDIRSALITYWGSAHLVMPMSSDKNIINLFASSLEPAMMPKRGDALYEAVKLASEQFLEMKGSIIVVADSVTAEALEKIHNDSELEAFNIILYSVSSEALRSESMQDGIFISFDDSDIEALNQSVKHQFKRALSQKKGQYENSGYELLPLILLLSLLLFRRGFIGELWRLR